MDRNGEERTRRWMQENEIAAGRVVESWLDDHPNKLQQIAHKYQLSQQLQLSPPSNKLKTCRAISQPDTHLRRHTLRHFESTPNFHSRRMSLDQLRRLNKHDMFLELLRDIVSPDFDVNNVSHKILLNVLVLTEADRSSMFLVSGSDENPVLVSRFFDVTDNSTVDSALHKESEALKIPINENSIVGSVALTKKTINLEDAYQDPRFNTDVDKLTGYRTKSILCMPITAANNQLLGVAQVINKNKNKGQETVFTKRDEEVFQTYLYFCGIVLYNAQLFDTSMTTNQRLEVILGLAKKLLLNTTSLENTLKRVMEDAQIIIPCKEMEVFLMDTNQRKNEKIEFHKIFKMGADREMSAVEDPEKVQRFEMVFEVAKSGQPINFSEPSSDNTKPREGIPSFLCMPIFNPDDEVIGVVRLSNKDCGVPFTTVEEEAFEMFAVFCGLGIHSVMNYEAVLLAKAKQSVVLEVLSYHASASEEDAQKLMQVQLPSAPVFHVDKFSFDDMLLSEDETVLASVRMFEDCGFIRKFNMDRKIVYRWMLTVKKNYRPVSYHNWRHAFNVAQTMFTIITTGELSEYLTDLEQLALMVACFCHDLDHRGTNNAFQKMTESPLATLYSTSTMEHHHFDHCVLILNSEGNNILSGLTAYKYKGVIRMVEACILATDLAVYSRVNKNKFQAILDECKKRTDIDCSKLLWMRHRELLRGLLMTACDLAAITKPWEVQYRVADLVATEFFQQGDMERDALNTEPTGMMDRRLINELPSMQVGFIDYICLPLYRTLLNLSATLQPLLDGAMKNRDNWHTLAGHKHIESTGIDEDATVEKADAVVKQAEGVTLEPAGTGIEEGAIVEVPEGETSVAKKPAAATAAAATASSAATASGSLEMKRAVATGDAVTSEPIQAWSSDSMVHTKRLQQDKTSKKTKCTVGQRSRTPLDSI